MTTWTHSDLTQMIDTLRDALAGEVIAPGHPTYDEARHVWNGLIDRRPAVIARCANAGDVQQAVSIARRHRPPVSIRGGGHQVAGSAVCNDGLVIDLSSERRRGRSGAPACTRWRRCHLGRRRSGHAGSRSGGDGRRGVDHRGRRIHPGRRHGRDHACARPGLRQPAVDRDRHRGRQTTARRSRRTPRPVLGRTRRWPRDRRGDVVRVRSAPPRPRSGQRHRLLPLRSGRARPARLP